MNALSDTGTELTAEQLDDVDGGAVGLAIALIVAATYMVWWASTREE